MIYFLKNIFLIGFFLNCAYPNTIPKTCTKNKANPKNCKSFLSCEDNLISIAFCPLNQIYNEEADQCQNLDQAPRKLIQKCQINKNFKSDIQPLTKEALKQNSLELKVSWLKLEQNSIFPSKLQIQLPLVTEKLESDNKFETLNLKKFSYSPNNFKLISSLYGNLEEFSFLRKDWDVFSDENERGSLIISKLNSPTGPKTFYNGVFNLNNTSYQLMPDNTMTLFPLHPLATKMVVLNGSYHYLTQQVELPKPKDFEHSLMDKDSIDTLASKIELMEMKDHLENSKRVRWIELLVYIDYSIYNKFLLQLENYNRIQAVKNIKNYFSQVIIGVNDRYKKIVSNYIYRATLKGFVIAQTPYDAPFVEEAKTDSYTINPYTALNKLEKWIASNKQKFNLDFDSLLLFTDYNMKYYSHNSYRTITGLANIGQTCTDMGLSITKFFGEFATITTAAHELGHNMGALHDGNSPNCKYLKNYIMASAPSFTENNDFYNIYNFSICSTTYFDNYVDKLEKKKNNCLKNKPNPNDASKKLLGKHYSVDEQCRFLFGESSFYCAGGGQKDKLICVDLICWDPTQNKCKPDKARQRAFEGTSCGNKHICKTSTCVYSDDAKQGPDGCFYGDYQSTFNLNGQIVTCDQMVKNHKEKCYEKHYFDMCCNSCKKVENSNKPNCLYGDKINTCSSISTSTCYDSYYEEKCCETCPQRAKNISQNCKYGDKADWCKTIELINCYQGENTCCESCSKKSKDSSDPNCKYGDKSPGCTKDMCSNGRYNQDCCSTCNQNLPPPSDPQPPPSDPQPPPSDPQSPNCQDKAPWCSTLHPSGCYQAKDTCCLRCKKFKETKPNCEYGDKAPWCESYVKSSDDCRNPDVSSQCCKTCDKKIKPIFNECKMGNTYGYCEYLESHNCYQVGDLCCDFCRTFETDMPSCEFGDRANWCSTYIRSGEECRNYQINKTCCHSCHKISKLRKSSNTPTISPDVDLAPWCKTIYKGHCYEPSVEKTCLYSCKQNLNKSNPSCKYGDYYEWCKQEYCSLNEKECCETCQK